METNGYKILGYTLDYCNSQNKKALEYMSKSIPFLRNTRHIGARKKNRDIGTYFPLQRAVHSFHGLSARDILVIRQMRENNLIRFRLGLDFSHIYD